MDKLYESINGDESSVIYQLRSNKDAAALWLEVEQLVQPTFFHSWTWVGSWLELIIPIACVYLFCFYHQGSIKSVCCLTKNRASRKKGMVSVVQLQLNEYLKKNYNLVNGYNGILVAPGFERLAWNYFFQAAEKFDSSWDEIAIGPVCDTGARYCFDTNRNLGQVIDKNFFEFKKDLDPSMAEQSVLLDTFKRKSRQQMKQTLVAFSEWGEAKVELAKDIQEAEYFFDQMGLLHTQRWNKVDKKGSFGNPVWVNFHKQLIRRNFGHGCIQMLKVSVGDKVLGYLYGHLYKGCVYMHQTGFLQLEDNRLRAGCLSHFLAMQANAANGVRSYNFLPDFEESYKKFFVNQGAPVYWIHLRRNRWKFNFEMLLDKLKLYAKRSRVNAS